MGDCFEMRHSLIYFAFTRPQLEYVIRHRRAHRDATAYLLYAGPANTCDKSLNVFFDEVVKAESNTGRLDKRNRLAYKIASSSIKRWLGNDTAYLIFPGILHPVANALFSVFLKESRVRTLIYADGISAYLNIGLPYPWRLRFSILRWIGMLKGFPRGIAVQGHPHGLDMPGVFGLIAEYPDLLTGHGKPVEKLYIENYLRHHAETAPEEVVFVGQPHLIREIDLHALYLSMAEGLKNYFGLKLVYRPHHFEPKKQIEAASKAGFAIVDSRLPFDEWLRATSPAAVVSFRSTILINAGRILGKSDCVYTFAPFLVQPPDESGGIDDIRAIMMRFGVRVFPPESMLGKLEHQLANTAAGHYRT